ncbi:hypothetical protein EDB83DRAFT_2512131 [Lactarius deliciosus]|nr:hypothetical protein EDB83DRAFT_2512131 [Lactarius deliciosus]
MADYNLWYFVEGKDTFGLVKISKDNFVALLAQYIQRQLSNTYCKGIDPWQLDLLKVDIERTPQLINHDLRAPDGATKMDRAQLINEIWLDDQPNQRHFHICVRLPGDFIDVDWGGQVGEASSPTLELNPELLEDRMSDDLIITKDDDVQMLTKTLEKL